MVLDSSAKYEATILIYNFFKRLLLDSFISFVRIMYINIVTIEQLARLFTDIFAIIQSIT